MLVLLLKNNFLFARESIFSQEVTDPVRHKSSNGFMQQCKLQIPAILFSTKRLAFSDRKGTACPNWLIGMLRPMLSPKSRYVRRQPPFVFLLLPIHQSGKRKNTAIRCGKKNTVRRPVSLFLPSICFHTLGTSSKQSGKEMLCSMIPIWT